MIDGLGSVSFTRNKLFPIIAFFTFYSLPVSYTHLTAVLRQPSAAHPFWQ